MGWRRVSAALVAAAGFAMVALGTLGTGGESARALTNCTVTDYSLDAQEQAFLTLINNYRQQNGLNALTISTNLNRDAAWMVNDLATNAYFSHTDSLGRAPYARAVDCGYPTGAGENLAAGSSWDTAQETFDAWKASPGHNSNMLLSYYRQIGIARFYLASSPYGWYWATEFGASDDGTGGSPPPTNTPTPTPTATPTPSPTQTPTQAPTQPPPPPPSSTPTPSPTATNPPPTSTPTATNTPASTATPPPAPTNTPPPTPSSQAQLPPATSAPSPSATNPPTSAPTQAPTSVPTQTPPSTPTSLALQPGANLVAWPVADAAPGLAFKGKGVAIVYAWDAQRGAWLHYSPELPDVLNNLKVMRRGEAYWVIARNAAQVAVGY